MKKTLKCCGILTLCMACLLFSLQSFAVVSGGSEIDAGTTEVEAESKAEAKIPPPSILGIQLGAGREETEKRLQQIGERVASDSDEEGDYKQLWRLEDERFANALVHFDDNFRVKWITAYVRTDGKRFRFSDIGDPSLAHQAGRYIYSWRVEAQGNRPGYMYQARGKSPEFVSSVSLTGVAHERQSLQLKTSNGVEE